MIVSRLKISLKVGCYLIKKTPQSIERGVLMCYLNYAFVNKDSIAWLNVSLGLNAFAAKSALG